MQTKKKPVSSCDICVNYEYDDEYECYMCDVDLDEDEVAHLMESDHYSCPYFVMGDEYAIVKHQI